VLRRRDEAEGSEAPAVVRLSTSCVIGRPLRADATGRLVTADPVALRIAGGRIVAVGPLASHRAPSAADAVLGDDEALLLPAFADPHLHLVACAADRAGLDVSQPRPGTIAALLGRLTAAACALPAGSWLRASGHDEAWLAERGHPDRAELDRAVPRHPLRLRHATRHASLLNALAFARVEQALGTLDRERAPRDPHAVPLGIVYGLEPEITKVVGPLEAPVLRQALSDVGAELAAHGVVHLDEVTASNDAARVALLAAAVDDGALPQQIRVYLGDADEVAAARRAARGRLVVAGVKLLARSVDEAHAPAFRARLAGARRCGLPVAVHAVDADVAAVVLDALRDAPPRADGAGGSPDRLEHCSLCPPELARRIAAAGVAVVTQPAFLAIRGVKYSHEVEPPLWPWLYPLRALRAAGVLVVGSSDAPVVPFDPRLGLDGASRRRGSDGVVLAPGEILDDGAALDLFTRAAARLRGASGPSGIDLGAPADLLVAEPGFLDSSADWRALRVRHTLSAGRAIA